MYLTQYPFFNAVAVDTSGGRKKQACYYCGELTSKLPRHMMCKHATEKEVITALSFPNGSSSRKAAWHKLRSRGNYHHNMTFMDVGKSNLIVARKPNQSGRNLVLTISCRAHTAVGSIEGKSFGNTQMDAKPRQRANQRSKSGYR